VSEQLGTSRPQQVTRLPHLEGRPIRPGAWVKLRDFGPEKPGVMLSGKVREVRSLSATITRAEQKYATWRVHFTDGMAVEWHDVVRFATTAEIERAKRLA
jgi:hypothetical protein